MVSGCLLVWVSWGKNLIEDGLDHTRPSVYRVRHGYIFAWWLRRHVLVILGWLVSRLLHPANVLQRNGEGYVESLISGIGFPPVV